MKTIADTKEFFLFNFCYGAKTFPAGMFYPIEDGAYWAFDFAEISRQIIDKAPRRSITFSLIGVDWKAIVEAEENENARNYDRDDDIEPWAVVPSAIDEMDLCQMIAALQKKGINGVVERLEDLFAGIADKIELHRNAAEIRLSRARKLRPIVEEQLREIYFDKDYTHVWHAVENRLEENFEDIQSYFSLFTKFKQELTEAWKSELRSAIKFGLLPASVFEDEE